MASTPHTAYPLMPSASVIVARSRIAPDCFAASIRSLQPVARRNAARHSALAASYSQRIPLNQGVPVHHKGKDMTES